MTEPTMTHPWPEDFWAGIEQLISLAWREGWRAAEWQQRRAEPEGLWPYLPETVAEVYHDWRAYGPGATMPGGPAYRDRSKMSAADTLARHAPAPSPAMLEAAGRLSPEAAKTIFGAYAEIKADTLPQPEAAPCDHDWEEVRRINDDGSVDAWRFCTRCEESSPIVCTPDVIPGRPVDGYESPFKTVGHDGPCGDMRLADE